MFTFRNALRNIVRAKGRSLLIGIIITIIALSVCIGLCIRQSAANAKESALSDMTITAQISIDRDSAMCTAYGESTINSLFCRLKQQEGIVIAGYFIFDV